MTGQYYIKLLCLVFCGLIAWPAPVGSQGGADQASEIEILERRLETVRLERLQTENHLEDLKQKLAGIHGDLAELEAIKGRLGTDLGRVLEVLANRVENGLPVNRESRAAALTAAQAGLGDYDADLRDKLKGVMSVLLQNVGYVGAVELSEGDFTLDGQPVRVRTLRLGDLFLLASSPDGRRAWRWNRRAKAFEPVDKYTSEIESAMEMAAGGRVVSLVRLPVGNLMEEQSE